MISFPGIASSGINCGTAAILGSTSFTLAAWINRAGNGVIASTGSGGLTNLEPIIFKCVAESEGSTVDGNYCLGYDPTTQKFGGDFEDAASGVNRPFVFTTARGAGLTGWMHVAVTYDFSTFTWAGYVNGVADGTLTLSGALSSAQKQPRNDSIQQFGVGTAINSTGTRTGGWNGFISDVAKWSVVLTAAEIALLASSRLKGMPAQIRPASLNIYLPMNETADGTTVSTSASIIRDRSANTNHGTAFGTLTGRAENYLSY